MGTHHPWARFSQRQLAKAELTGQQVVDRLALLGFQDIRKLFDADGNLVPIHLLSDEAAVILSDEVAVTVGSMEVIIKNAKAGDGQTGSRKVSRG